MSALLFQAALDRAVRWLGWPSCARRDGHAGNQLFEPADGFGAVFLLAAEFLRLDDDYAILADPVIAQLEQALADCLGQR